MAFRDMKLRPRTKQENDPRGIDRARAFKHHVQMHRRARTHIHQQRARRLAARQRGGERAERCLLGPAHRLYIVLCQQLQTRRQRGGRRIAGGREAQRRHTFARQRIARGRCLQHVQRRHRRLEIRPAPAFDAATRQARLRKGLEQPLAPRVRLQRRKARDEFQFGNRRITDQVFEGGAHTASASTPS